MGDILLPDDPQPLARSVTHPSLAQLGKAADDAARSIIFLDYRQRQAPQTLRRHTSDLKVFADFLATVGLVVPLDVDEVPLMATEAEGWQGITGGLLIAFRTWMLNEGYAIRSINARLSTIRTYARLAHQAGVIDAVAWSQIKSIGGYRKTEGEHVDTRRRQNGTDTRVSTKKSLPNVLSAAQIAELKQQALTCPTSRSLEIRLRDYVLVCLLADLGLRCGEVARLTWECVTANYLVVDRPKVNKVQRHRLIGDANDAMQRYRAVLQGADDQPLLARFDPHGTWIGFGMPERAIHHRIRFLGKLLGLPNLGPHDLRHSWATRLAQKNVSIQALRDAGGWSNFATPSRYVAQQDIANDMIELDADLDD